MLTFASPLRQSKHKQVMFSLIYVAEFINKCQGCEKTGSPLVEMYIGIAILGGNYNEICFFLMFIFQRERQRDRM